MVFVFFAFGLLAASPPAQDDIAAEADGGTALREMTLEQERLTHLRDYFQRNPITIRTMAAMPAKQFLKALIARDLVMLASFSQTPFYIEGQRYNSPTTAATALKQAMEENPGASWELLDLEILSPSEMRKKYGPPPKRLAHLPWNAPDSVIAVANLSGRAAILILRPRGNSGTFTVAAFTD
ncbi:MAG: hypothetical protein ACKVPX_04595 [Myxococcaceae bacterium]